MKLKSNLFLVAIAAFAVGNAAAAPVHMDNTNVSSWDVGSGQVNGNFSVTDDNAFAGANLIQLGLRAEQRSAGAVTPTFGDATALDGYRVLAGTDTTQPNPARAWWNFQLSIGYGNTPGVDISDLDSLTLKIEKLGGTNGPPSGTGIHDLLALRALIDDRNANNDATFNDMYQISQNPVFGWFSPYSLAQNETFAYRFTLTATDNDDSVLSSMCVATEGLDCSGIAVIPEPSILALLGLGLAGIGVMRRRKA